jgi:hypothetical protein
VRCDGCQELSSRGRLVWSASLPVRKDGRPGESFDFCSDECFADFLDGRIAAREQRKAAREAAGPSPLDMPAQAEVAS